MKNLNIKLLFWKESRIYEYVIMKNNRYLLSKIELLLWYINIQNFRRISFNIFILSFNDLITNIGI